MTLPSSPNSIKFSQIQNEFGGSDPIRLSEYYRGNLYVPLNASSQIPTGSAGTTIRMGSFRGSSNLAHPISTNPYFSAEFNSNSNPKSVTVSNLNQFGQVKTLIVAHLLLNGDGDIGIESCGTVTASNTSSTRDTVFFSRFSDETHYISFYRIPLGSLDSTTLSVVGETKGFNDDPNSFGLWGWVIPNDVSVASSITVNGGTISISSHPYGVSFVSAIRNRALPGTISSLDTEIEWRWARAGFKQFNTENTTLSYSASGALGMAAVTYRPI